MYEKGGMSREKLPEDMLKVRGKHRARGTGFIVVTGDDEEDLSGRDFAPDFGLLVFSASSSSSSSVLLSRVVAIDTPATIVSDESCDLVWWVGARRSLGGFQREVGLRCRKLPVLPHDRAGHGTERERRGRAAGSRAADALCSKV